MKRITYFFTILLALLFITNQAFSQNTRIIGGTQIDLDNNAGSHVIFSNASGGVGINATGVAPSACALLDLSSITKGFLPPRMTSAQEAAICGGAAPAGLIVFNTTTNTLDVYSGTSWGASGWALTGNTGTTAATNFLGTTDNQDLVVKTNNIERMRVSPGGTTVTVSAGTASTGIQINGNSPNQQNGLSATIVVGSGVSAAVAGNISSATHNLPIFGGNFAATTTSGGSLGAAGVNGFATASAAGTSATGGTFGATSTNAGSSAIGVSSFINSAVGSGNTGYSGTVNSSPISNTGMSLTVSGANTTGITVSANLTAGGSQAVGIIASGTTNNANTAFGGSFTAGGSSFANIGVSANASGPSSQNVALDASSQGANSIGIRTGAFNVPVTGISVVNATTTGINIAGAPTSLSASGNVTIAGTTKMGATGTPVKAVYKLTTPDFSGLIAANSSFTITYFGSFGAGGFAPVPVVGDAIIVGADPGVFPPGLTWSATFTGSDVFTINIVNGTSGGVTMGAGNFYITAIKY